MKESSIINNKGFLYIVFYCIIASLIHLLYPDREATILPLLIICSIMVDLILPFCLLLCSNVIMVEFGSMTTVTSLFVTLISFYLIFITVKGHYQWWILKSFALLAFGIIISYYVGYKTDNIALLNMLMLSIQMTAIAITVSKTDRSKYIVCALVAAGIAVSSVVLYLFATGQATFVRLIQLAYGDEEWGGSTKALSTAASVPAIYFVCLVFFNKQHGFLKIAEIITIIFLVLLIVLTYSRGVMLALFLASVYLARVYFKNISTTRIISFGILAFVIYSAIDSLVLDSSRLYEGLDTGNGRTDIWLFFFQRLFNNGITGFIFGFGPGDSKRITDGSVFDGFYAHSVILDYGFAYGLVGMYFMFRILSFSLIHLYKNKNVLYCCILIMQMVVYFSHGSSNNMAFNYTMALSLGMAVRSINSLTNKIYGKEENSDIRLSSKRYWRY